MKWRVYLVFSVLAIIATLGFPSSSSADTIVQGFKTKTTLQPGLIVGLDKVSKDTVEPVARNEAERIYGIVIDPAQAPATVRQQGEQTFIATGGNYPTLVSTENGAIGIGDYISVSSIGGIGSKASEQATVIGRALEPFDGKSSVITTTSEGRSIGKVMVGIVPGKNPLVEDDIAIPAPLKRFGEAIAGKNVSASRIYAALAIFVVTSIIAISVLWVGIRSGMISIGRNPLSRLSIMNSLIQIIVTAILVFIVGMFGVYLLLRL